MTQLTEKKCLPCEGGVEALSEAAAQALLQQLDGWDLKDNAKEIIRTFHFNDYYQTMAFVNAIAWMAHQENHHPDLAVSYNNCTVRYSTHAIGGLSDNDFICAAKVDALLKN